MARASMATIITRVRLMIYDPAGASQIFTDDQIQDELDKHQTEVRYFELDPIETITSGGVVSYYRFSATWFTGLPWEEDTTFVNSSYATVTPDTNDYKTGNWTFSTARTDYPILLNGKFYDIFAAAADLCVLWASRLALEYDTSSDDQKFMLAQQREGKLMMAEQYRRQARPKAAHGQRSDVRR